jgi:thiosulfate/3-mercaptopyruvate sulfurtransferase
VTRRSVHRAVLLLAALALAGRVAAQEPDAGDAKVTHNRDILASTEWLASYLTAANVHVIHVGRTDSLYRAGHIPGARFLLLSAVATTVGGLTNEFPAPARLIATFRDLGVGDSGNIVIYGDDPGLLAARAWVALDILGHGTRAAVLDGGLVKWRAENRPVETTVRAATPRPFTGQWRADRIVPASWVRSHLRDSTVAFIDARPADQFNGAEPPCPPSQPACPQIPAARRGHLPRAGNVYWMNALVSRENPVLRSMHFLHEELWVPSGADRGPVTTVVAYCRTGMQASHAYFVARYIGYRDVRLYDGSFIEWAGLPAEQYPVEAGHP